MSAPRPPPEQSVPLDQILPPSIIKLIWAGEILLIIVIVAGFGMVISKIVLQILRLLRSGEKFQFLPTQIPDGRLTYRVPVEFNRYRDRRDGWKQYLPWVAQLSVFSVIASIGSSLFHGHLPNLGSFFIIFFGSGFMLFGVMVFQRNYDQPITFYKEGIGNRPKGRKNSLRFLRQRACGTHLVREPPVRGVYVRPKARILAAHSRRIWI